VSTAVLNQFDETYDVSDLSKRVQEVATRFGIDVQIRNLRNPRHELEDHYYNPDRQELLKLGYQPTHDVEAELEVMLGDLLKYRDRIATKKHLLNPAIWWDGRREKVGFVESPEGV
jgi:UDP-sulfoquinovose synthase